MYLAGTWSACTEYLECEILIKAFQVPTNGPRITGLI